MVVLLLPKSQLGARAFPSKHHPFFKSRDIFWKLAYKECQTHTKGSALSCTLLSCLLKGSAGGEEAVREREREAVEIVRKAQGKCRNYKSNDIT